VWVAGGGLYPIIFSVVLDFVQPPKKKPSTPPNLWHCGWLFWGLFLCCFIYVDTHKLRPLNPPTPTKKLSRKNNKNIRWCVVVLVFPPQHFTFTLYFAVWGVTFFCCVLQFGFLGWGGGLGGGGGGVWGWVGFLVG